MDALGGLPEIDETRLAYAGFSLGGILGALCCAADPRPRAAALALAGGGFGPEEVDPCTHIGKLAPRPLLLVGARRDQRVPRRATEALFDAAGEPKRLEWFDGDHSHLPGAALKAIWVFLRDQLGV
jgi:dienelactone hydrolase